MKLVPAFAPAAFVLLWATGFIGARYAMPWAGPFEFLTARFVLACLLVGAIARLAGSAPADRKGAVQAMIAGTMIHGVYLGGVFWAIRHGMPAGLSALIVGLQPLITALMAGGLLGERTLPRHWAGLAIGFAGIAIVLVPPGSPMPKGVGAATLAASVLAVVGMSAGTIWQKRFVSRLDLLTGTAWQYFGAALMMIVLAALFERDRIVLNGELVFALAWLVLVLSTGAIMLLMLLIRRGEVARVASLFYLVPAVTAVLAWALFGETLTMVQIGGMALAGVGVALAASQPSMRARASA